MYLAPKQYAKSRPPYLLNESSAQGVGRSHNQLSQQLAYHARFLYARETEVEALELVSEAMVVDAQ